MFTLPERVNILFGQPCLFENVSSFPYNLQICEIIDYFSKQLLSISDRKMADVITLAYWCRKSNIDKIKKEFNEDKIRIGLGTVFHIPPSNVPINIAFSFIFGLLAGNANIVKLSDKDFPQIDIIIEALKKTTEKYPILYHKLLIIRYNKENIDITTFLSKKCQGRVIWGGDVTVDNIRKIPISYRGVEMVFPDRYSLCIINANVLINNTSQEINELAQYFYNDAYIMDQNACSCPHMVIWLGEKNNVIKIKDIFWSSLYKVAQKKYNLEPIMSISKYEKLCIDAQDKGKIIDVTRYGNILYCLQLSQLSSVIDSYKGQFGYFYEYLMEDISELVKYLNSRCQTLTYYGINKNTFYDLIYKNNLRGIDRIVPIGKALDIDVIWDGYDIMKTLSRICEVK